MPAEINRTVLENGVTLLTFSDRRLPILSLHVWYDVGSINENTEEAGISHFIEHMLFKGTKKRGPGEIAPAIEKIGGRMNAATSKDFTFYNADIPSEYIELGLDIMADIAFNASFPENEIEKERKVILEEIKRGKDNPERELYEIFMETMFQPSPYAASVIGTKETVGGIKREDLQRYYKKHYLPSRMAVVLAGNFDEEKTIAAVKKYFGAAPAGKAVSPEMKPPSREKLFAEKKGNAVFPYLIIGKETVDVSHEDQYALDVLSAVLGHGQMSRLNNKIKEKEKLVLGISAGHSTEKHTGFFYVFASCEKKNLESVKGRIREELELIKKGVAEEELARVKAQLLTQFILETETNDGRASRIGISYALGDYLLGERYLDKITAITTEDVGKAAEKYLIMQEMVTAQMLPEK